MNASHGGPDSRKMPAAQTAEEVAAVIADVIRRPRADVYTRAGAEKLVQAYYAAEDMGAAPEKPRPGQPGEGCRPTDEPGKNAGQIRSRRNP